MLNSSSRSFPREISELQWVTSVLALIVLWGFTICALVEPDETRTQAAEWQKWVSQNWTWLYIGTQVRRAQMFPGQLARNNVSRTVVQALFLFADISDARTTVVGASMKRNARRRSIFQKRNQLTRGFTLQRSLDVVVGAARTTSRAFTPGKGLFVLRETFAPLSEVLKRSLLLRVNLGLPALTTHVCNFLSGAQNVWMFFLIWLCFSRFGKLKLGRSDEKPEYNDISWFAMLFSCGIGVGIYYWSVFSSSPKFCPSHKYLPQNIYPSLSSI